MMMTNMMTNNTISKIAILLFGIILMSAVPFASAQFVVGGSSGGSGGSDYDNVAPLFVGNSITIDQTVLVDGPGNDPVVVSAGNAVEFVVTASDNRGVNNITHIDVFLNHDGKRILNNLQETYVSFKYGDFIIQNPQGLIESATMDTSVVGDDKKFVFNVIFDETFDTSNVLIRAWDAYGNISMLYLLDSLEVVPYVPTPEPVASAESAPTADESTDAEIVDTPVDVPEGVSDDQEYLAAR